MEVIEEPEFLIVLKIKMFLEKPSVTSRFIFLITFYVFQKKLNSTYLAIFSFLIDSNFRI